MKEVEIELKNLVTSANFYKLLHMFQITDDQFFIQTNHYYDTINFSLKSMNSALRIRELGNQLELTLKIPHHIGLLEVTDLLPSQPRPNNLSHIDVQNGEVKRELKKREISLEELIYFGSLTTKRAQIPYKDGLLVFDQSSYLNKVDFEIEYEVDDFEIGNQHFNQLMEQLNIPIQVTDNKIKRFFIAKFGKS